MDISKDTNNPGFIMLMEQKHPKKYQSNGHKFFRSLNHDSHSKCFTLKIFPNKISVSHSWLSLDIIYVHNR